MTDDSGQTATTETISAQTDSEVTRKAKHFADWLAEQTEGAALFAAALKATAAHALGGGAEYEKFIEASRAQFKELQSILDEAKKHRAALDEAVREAVESINRGAR